MSTDRPLSYDELAHYFPLMRQWCHLLHACLTSCIPLGVQNSMARSA